MGTNTARDLLWPSAADNILVRVVFLHVGQGACTLVLFADGDDFGVLLADVNLDGEHGGIHVPNMLTDLLDGRRLDIFMNSHPHEDHLRGVKLLHSQVGIDEIWHSGHKPSKENCPSFPDLEDVIEAVCQRSGAEAVTELLGSDSPEPLGSASYYVFAPAEYVVDEIAEETPDDRKARIHEQCAVFSVGTRDVRILVPGDADRRAFENHIAEHHRERLGAVVMAAPHHGSKSFFFLEGEGEDPYLDALESIAPTYVVISAPTSGESPHDHPHQEAVERYVKQVGSMDNVLHTGEKRYSFICDIYQDGGFGGVSDDKGALAKAYPANEGECNDGGTGNQALSPAITTGTRVDDRPMGGTVE